jgi:hypothetical protein
MVMGPLEIVGEKAFGTDTISKPCGTDSIAQLIQTDAIYPCQEKKWALILATASQ